jgi:hypothetical protein
VQELVEVRAPGLPGAGCPGRRGQQLQAVTGADAGDTAAFGCHDRRDPVQRHPGGRQVDRRGLSTSGHRGEPGRIADPRQLSRQELGSLGAKQPGQARPQHIGGDQAQQARRHRMLITLARFAVAAVQIPRQRQQPPVRGRIGLGARGEPAVLPAAGKPAQHDRHTAAAGSFRGTAGLGERRGDQVAPYLIAAHQGHRPSSRERPGREPDQQFPVIDLPATWPAGSASGRWGLRGHLAGGHDPSVPNKMLKLAGS